MEEKRNLPMNWWEFCKYFRFPCTLFLLSIDLLIAFGNLSDDLLSNKLMIFALIYDIGLIIYTSIVYYNFLKRTEKGYKLLISYIFVELICGSFVYALKQINQIDFTINFIVYCAIYGLIFAWPNYIYFSKRKYVFETEENKESIEIKEENEEKKEIEAKEKIEKKNETEKYCTKCGMKVQEEWSFCNSCGNKLK